MTNIPEKNFLEDSRTAYFKPPYHNFEHGVHVRDAVLKMTNDDITSPIAFAAMLHDACHTGEARAPWDEKIAVKIAQIMGRNYGLSQDFIQQSETAILGTIFQERANIKLESQKIIADADLSALGGDYDAYIESATMLLLETHKAGVTDEEILSFFQYQETFFNSLTEISGIPESGYLTAEGRKAFPHFSRNKDIMAKQIEEHPEELIAFVRRQEQLPVVQSYRKEDI